MKNEKLISTIKSLGIKNLEESTKKKKLGMKKADTVEINPVIDTFATPR